MKEKTENNSPEKKKNFPLQLIQQSRSAPQDSLRLYLQEINKFPILEPEEEYNLAKRVREEDDQDAAFRMITSHLRLVVKIAMDFQRRWMKNVLDLIQEGNVGLMKAVQKFDPEKGIKFSYYASFWIKAYILKFIMDNWRMVKIGTTQAQRKLFYNLNKEKQRLESLGFDPSAAQISENLNVSRGDVVEMGQRLGAYDLSLDSTISDDSDATRMDFIPALDPDVEEQLAKEEIQDKLHKNIKDILPHLNEKEKDILNLRLLSDSPVTLREIGEKYGITRERVRQIEARLLQKIRQHLSESIKDFSSAWITHE
ncbi:MAG: sigma-70 family RNA polymerase sigma factor [Desulfovibrionales bacterium]